MRRALFLVLILLSAHAADAQIYLRATQPLLRTPAVRAALDSVRTLAPAASDTTALPEPVVRVYGRSGLEVTLPDGWRGIEEIDESRAPFYSVYTFTSRMPGQLLDGTRLRVERLTGLHPMDQERWRTGQIGYGYFDTRPTARADTDLEGSLAFEVTGPKSQGIVAFVRRGQTYWSILVTGPSALWTLDRREIEDLLYGVAFL
jgi:hypothetical protein